jgi:hypothetical protein
LHPDLCYTHRWRQASCFPPLIYIFCDPHFVINILLTIKRCIRRWRPASCPPPSSTLTW